MSLSFYKTTAVSDVARFLAATLDEHLAKGQRILWLVPGGSAITVAVRARQLLKQPTEKLIVSLTDERFGEEGHADSNWHQLEQAGFDFGGIQALPVLGGKGLEETANDYSKMLTKILSETDYRIGFFGVGADAHIAGIKPANPAINSKALATGYKWDDYTRLTITPKVFSLLDEAVVYMKGEEKWPVVDRIGQGSDISSEPVQLLLNLPKVSIFNDKRGEEI